MAVIDTRGLVDDGNPNLTVVGPVTVTGLCSTGQNLMVATQLAASGTTVIPTSGFFQVSATQTGGAGNFTGSLPSPSVWSGADLMIVEIGGVTPILLTGSIAMMNSVGANQVSGTLGTKLTITKNGSIVLASDQARWLVCGVNGVATLAP